MLDKLKAIAAAVVGAASLLVARKFGFTLSAEVEAAIVGAIMYAVVYFVPNIDKPAA